VTYSIVAADEATGSFGVAVASKALCVGAHVPWGRERFGAVATQAWHDLRYGWEGLALLEQGHSAASVVQSVTAGDDEAPHRQLGVVDARGRVASYTGSRCLPWAGGMCGGSYAVQGNLLAGPQVVEAMAAGWEEAASLPLARRLVAALVAGDEAGGDRRGRQSAALKIWGADGVIADLRVDDAPRPVHRLERLLAPYWLDYCGPSSDDALPLTGPVGDRVAAALGTPAGEVELALERWASEENLERRVLPGAVDPVVLEVLEHGRERVLRRLLSEAGSRAPPTRNATSPRQL
jgi:uncharacterized Ntn-hydrolase superfamily protein